MRHIGASIGQLPDEENEPAKMMRKVFKKSLNNKIRVVPRRSFGFRTFKAMEMTLYHTLGRLPGTEVAHRFC
jgi:hypothetical protein